MTPQEIVDMIVGSERYAQARAFEDRVYRDEPILRTGAQAFGRERPRPGAPEAARPRPSQRLQPLAREPMPERYRKMRALARSSSSWANRYGTGGSRLFFEQGKFMEDFEDDFEGAEDFAMYYPSYEEMSDRQLRCYFGWRTRLRAGKALEAPVSFLFVHAYELLCGIGVEPGERGYAELQRFRAQYAGSSPAFDAHLARWSHDYVVDHGLDPSLLSAQVGTFAVEAVATLRRTEELLLALPGGATWPDRVPAGWPQAEEVLDALVALSRYRADRSRFFRDHRADVAEVCARVFARMVAHCRKRRKTDLMDGLFGEPARVSYTMYPSALFWSPVPHEDVSYMASEAESYVCERGFWWRVLPCRRTQTNRELGSLLHAIDARMRLAYGDAHPLKERKGLPKYQGKFVDAEVAALIERRAAEEAARVRIDRSSLGRIRSASVRTREALLTDDEREDAEAAPPAPAATPETEPGMPAAGGSLGPARDAGPVAAAEGGLGLSEGEVALLLALLEGSAPPNADGMFLSLAVDAINEAFLDVVGDTVVEFDGEEPVLVADYEQDVRDALGAAGEA